MNTASSDDDLSLDKKTQILNAATKVLRVQGLQALSFVSIANEAGLSRQLVRYYYSDLDTLMVDLCGHLQKVYQDFLVAGIVDVAEVERLGFFFDFLFGVDQGHPLPDNLETYDALFAYAVGSESVKDRLCEKYVTLGSVILHELAIAHPALDHTACQELSFLIVSMMHAHWSYVATLGFSPHHNRIARGAIDRLIDSYIANAPAAGSDEKPWSRSG